MNLTQKLTRQEVPLFGSRFSVFSPSRLKTIATLLFILAAFAVGNVFAQEPPEKKSSFATISAQQAGAFAGTFIGGVAGGVVRFSKALVNGVQAGFSSKKPAAKQEATVLSVNQAFEQPLKPFNSAVPNSFARVHQVVIAKATKTVGD